MEWGILDEIANVNYNIVARNYYYGNNIALEYERATIRAIAVLGQGSQL